MTEAPIKVGERLGRYVILEWLGAGGMGVVYKAFDPELDRSVALKVLHALDDPERSLLREARLAARVASSRVVAIYDVGVAEGRVFMAMELAQGQTLDRWCRHETRGLGEKLMVLGEAAEGLAAAHAVGVIHGDFKPQNVLVVGHHAKLTDFGLGGRAREDADGSTTRTGGTPRYMAPEQAPSKQSSPLADQFSFAVAAWETLVGNHPFLNDDEPGPILEARPIRNREQVDLPRHVRRTLERALSFDPKARFADFDALLMSLRERRSTGTASRFATYPHRYRRCDCDNASEGSRASLLERGKVARGHLGRSDR